MSGLTWCHLRKGWVEKINHRNVSPVAPIRTNVRKKLVARLLEQHGRRCWLCYRPIRTHQTPTLDHVIPRSAGGTNELSNLRLAHHHCNQARGNGPPPELLLTERMETAA